MAGPIVATFTLLAAAIAWSGVAWVVMNVPPDRPFALAALYVFAFVGVTGVGALALWAARRSRDEGGELVSPARYLTHAMLLATIALFGLWLQTLRALTPVVAVLLIGLYAFLELAVLFGTRGSIELPMRR
ncbi:MAG: hypothetical protein NVSMB2_28320 [Chloroflexota bacterium]